MEYNATFLRKRTIAIFTVMTFLIAIAFILPSYASGQVKMVEGIITHVSDNNNITVRGQSYNINKASIRDSKEVALKKGQLKTGMKVHVYIHGNTVETVIVFDKDTIE